MSEKNTQAECDEILKLVNLASISCLLTASHLKASFSLDSRAFSNEAQKSMESAIGNLQIALKNLHASRRRRFGT